MRLFCGIDLPGGIIDSLGTLTKKLRPAVRINWSPVENLHITTKFIGDWPPERLEELKQALAPLAGRGAIPIEVRGLGWFPNPHEPRVFWAAVKAPPALAELARGTDAALKAIGVPAETRPFSPHLTLARIKAPVPLAELRQRIAQLESTEFGTFTAGAFHLYSSDRRPEGSVYTKLAEFSLNKP